jgi:hypothetical protein
MDQKPRLQKAPKPTDLEGWRQAISRGLLSTFRLEDIVASIQDLGPLADSNVRNPLARHLSNAMTRLLRRLVGLSHPNQGDDIIYRVHGQLLKPCSSQAQLMAKHFVKISRRASRFGSRMPLPWSRSIPGYRSQPRSRRP